MSSQRGNPLHRPPHRKVPCTCEVLCLSITSCFSWDSSQWIFVILRSSCPSTTQTLKSAPSSPPSTELGVRWGLGNLWTPTYSFGSFFSYLNLPLLLSIPPKQLQIWSQITLSLLSGRNWMLLAEASLHFLTLSSPAFPPACATNTQCPFPWFSLWAWKFGGSPRPSFLVTRFSFR